MRLLLRLVLLVLVLGLLLLGAGVWWFAHLDLNAHKDTLIAKVKEATGRDLRIDGPLEFAVWPKLRLNVGAIQLSNAPGFGAEPFFKLESAQLAIATWPLLSRRVEMDTIKLDGAEILLARNAEGQTNWADMAQGGEAKSEGEGLAALILGGIDITNTKLVWRDAQAEREVVLSGITVQSGPLTLGEPVALTVKSNIVATNPNLNGDVAITSTLTYDTDAELYAIDPFKFTANLTGKTLPGGKATLNGSTKINVDGAAGTARIQNLALDGLGHQAEGHVTLDGLKTATPGARGQVAIVGKDLSVLFKAFSLPGSAQVAALRDRRFNFKTEFSVDGAAGTLVLPVLEGEGLGLKLNGVLNGQRVHSDTPALDGKFSANSSDLPALLGILNQLRAAPGTSPTDLTKTFSHVRDRTFALDTEFAADLASGQLQIPKLQAKLLGNRLEAQLKATENAGAKPKLDGQFTAEGPDLTAVVLALGALQGIDRETLTALNAVLGKRNDRAFNIHTTLAADLAADKLQMPSISAELFSNKFTGALNADALTSGAPAIHGEMNADGPDLPALLALVGGLQGADSGLPGLAEMLSAAKDKAFSFATKFTFDERQGNAAVPSFAARALGLELNGTLAASGLNRPSDSQIEGRVGLKGTALESLLTALGNPDLGKVVQGVRFDAQLNGNARNVTVSPLTGELQVASPDGGKPVGIKLNVTETSANLERETLSVKGLTVTGLGLNATVNLNATALKTKPQYVGQLTVPVFNLRELLHAMNNPISARDASALTRVGLETALQSAPGGLELRGLNVKLDDTQIKGDLMVGDGDTGLKFDLKADQLNADRYLAPTAEDKAKPVTPEAAAAGAAQLPIDTLRGLNIDGKFSLANLQFSGLKLANVLLQIKAKNGLVGLNPANAELYGGRYQGVMAVDATGKVPAVNINTTLAKVAIKPLLTDMTGKSDLEGTVNFEAKLTARGNTNNALTKSLSGPASFAVTDGVFHGVDVPAVLKTAEFILESKTLQPIPNGGSTQFQSLTGSLDFQNGVVFNQDLLLDGAGFKVTGEGMLANLQDMTIKYDAKIGIDKENVAQTSANYNLGDYAIPIRCRGEISGTSCLPDLGELAKQAAGKAVKEKIKEKLEESMGGAGKALKNLLNF